MLEYKKIDILEGIDENKSKNSKEFSICHYCYFIHKNFKYDLYNGCSDVRMKVINFKKCCYYLF